ncbi:Vesicle trafficking between the ER and Golgi [Coemansia guatemalensis]|uniref:Vesicle trafficking between the ER and Golgi n=1 Tax=Coemansia guatemalensis TaxID=2761395 RepID=A0A9W8HNT6_9FUNG|nr:Vesicle trafficking between the ER and Golgi [Coemansia guatemalensis]
MNATITSPGSAAGGAGSGGGPGGTGPGDLLGKFSSISSRLAGFTDSTSIGSIFSNVRNLLPSHKQLPVTSLVESAMGGRAQGGGFRSAVGGAGSGGSSSAAAARMFEGFVHFDPRQARRGNLAGSNANALRGAHGSDGATQEAIVFMVGGGNYVEYQNLMEFAQRSTPRKRIVYGSTDIVNPASFLAQLARLNEVSQG